MKTKLIAMLATAVVLIALLVVNFSSGKNAEEEVVEEEPPEEYVLLESTKEDITEIYIKGTEEISLNLEGGIWRSMKDSHMPMNQTVIDSMASTLSGVKSNRKLEGKPSDFGLDSPEITITVGYGDGSTKNLYIGQQTAAQDNRYVTTDDDGLYLVSAYTLQKFVTTELGLVDKTIEQPDKADLKYVYYKQKGKPAVEMKNNDLLELSVMEQYKQGGQTPLILTAPLKDKEVYDSYFDEYFYAYVSALSFSETIATSITDPALYGFDNPTYELIVRSSETELNLVVGNDYDANNAYCSYRGVVYTIPQASISKLITLDVYSMIQKFVTLPNIDTVSSIVIQSEDEIHTGTLTHTPETETEKAKVSATVDGVVIEDESRFKLFYRILVGLMYDSTPEEGFVLADDLTPEVTITFTLLSGETITDEYYEYNNNFYIVKKNGNLEYIVNKKAVTDMLDSVESLKAGTLKRNGE